MSGQEALGSDVNRLTSVLVEICEANRDHRDYTRAQMRAGDPRGGGMPEPCIEATWNRAAGRSLKKTAR